MAYSTDDIAVARSLQFLSTYDYACSLHEEWSFLLQSRWGKMKCLYIVTRYIPFIFLATDLYLYFTPNENTGKCRELENIESGLGIVLVIVSERHMCSGTEIEFYSQLWCAPLSVLQEFIQFPVLRTISSPFRVPNGWNWRMNSSRVYGVLVSHNISYYACGFVLSVTNILISLLLQDPPYQIVLYEYAPPHPAAYSS
ncbi:hypothetical protein BDR06DRAFT_971806 [Suillus hirtellus]|nr:hypothetical protein BDR06DRAFT_971806 [Suillus hirtellus]